MKKSGIFTLSLACAATFFSLAIAENATETTPKQVQSESFLEKTKEAVKKAEEKVGDAASAAIEKTKEAASVAVEKTKETTHKVQNAAVKAYETLTKEDADSAKKEKDNKASEEVKSTENTDKETDAPKAEKQKENADDDKKIDEDNKADAGNMAQKDKNAADNPATAQLAKTNDDADNDDDADDDDENADDEDDSNDKSDSEDDDADNEDDADDKEKTADDNDDDNGEEDDDDDAQPTSMTGTGEGIVSIFSVQTPNGVTEIVAKNSADDKVAITDAILMQQCLHKFMNHLNHCLTSNNGALESDVLRPMIEEGMRIVDVDGRPAVVLQSLCPGVCLFGKNLSASAPVQWDAVVEEILPPYCLGVFTMPLPETLRAHYGLKPGDGLWVEYVVPNSPAAQAGIHRGDVLLEAAIQLEENGEKNKKVIWLNSPTLLMDLVNHSGEENMELLVLCGGKEHIISLTPITKAKMMELSQWANNENKVQNTENAKKDAPSATENKAVNNTESTENKEKTAVAENAEIKKTAENAEATGGSENLGVKEKERAAETNATGKLPPEKPFPTPADKASQTPQGLPAEMPASDLKAAPTETNKEKGVAPKSGESPNGNGKKAVDRTLGNSTINQLASNPNAIHTPAERTKPVALENLKATTPERVTGENPSRNPADNMKDNQMQKSAAQRMAEIPKKNVTPSQTPATTAPKSAPQATPAKPNMVSPPTSASAPVGSEVIIEETMIESPIQTF